MSIRGADLVFTSKGVYFALNGVERKQLGEGNPQVMDRPQEKGLVRMQKEGDQVRDAPSEDQDCRATYLDMERKGLSEGHSPCEDCWWRDMSEHGKEKMSKGVLTSLGLQRD